MEIYFLDMGIKQYGDCIVLTANDKKILIDGAHPQDLSSIKMQLKKILMQDPPFHFDLLFLTHCHDDHIGCLPELIATGDVTAKKCILADPKFRWDEDGDSDSASDGLADALMEEDHSNLSDEELEVFLSDIEQLKIRYGRMIKTLQDDSNVTLFQGVNAHNFTSLYNEFSDFGLKIIGPTKEQLQITQDALGVGRDAIADFIDKVPAADSDISRVDLYRQAFRAQAGDNEMLLDAPKNSGAINNQSIIISVEAEGWKALLAGDMQFAEPNVTGLEPEMEKLLNKVYDSGPYDIIKTSHHTSDNGLDALMLDRWIAEGTEFFVHSGGLKDDDHPDASVLQLLKARKSMISFARTDRNGLIKVAKDGSDLSLFLSKGRINNFTPNVETDEAVTEEVTPVKSGAAVTPAKAKGAMVTEERVVNAHAIQITATIPSQLSKVTIIVEIEGGEKKKSISGTLTTGDERVPRVDGRFDNLLFVTNSEKLKNNIGIAETAEVLGFLRAIPNAKLLDLEISDDAVQTAERVRAEVTNVTKGVVLIGGYDIIPSAQLNVLSDSLRQDLENEIGDESDENDTDDFIIWSDDIYGDEDGDFLPELPVSRIPDGKSATLILNCLNSPAFKSSDRFGVHNVKRPFAISVFDTIPFALKTQLEVAELCSPKSISPNTSVGAVYFMLHGHHADATRFSGEKAESGMHEAFDIYNVPKSCPGTVVFSGCCYGALIVLPKADRKEPDISIRSRTSEQSIALAFLNSGANAFVGCTGAHYSPKKTTDNFLGKPLHTAFWKNINEGFPPSQALLNAKKEYAVNMPHGLTRKLLIALEVKILHQFTCLGLGW